MSSRPVALTYSRVSSPNDTREASLETQEEAQVALAESRGCDVPLELRFRERWTGMESIYDRPVLLHIRDIVAGGRVQFMFCYDTDRLARDPRELLTVVADNHKHKVDTVFVKMDHAIQGRIGEMILYMKGFASALEWDAIRDRTMRAKQKIRNRGQWIGTGRPRDGLLWDKETRTRTANPKRAPVIRRIFAMAIEGTTSRQIARTLNGEGIMSSTGRPWSGKVIQKIIKDPTYKGVVYDRKTMPTEGRTASGNHRMKARPADQQIILDDARTEALVSAEDWERANVALRNNISKRGRPADPNTRLLTGYVWCGECRHRMYPSSSASNGSRCYRYACSGCGRVLGSKWVDKMAWDWIVERAATPGYLRQEIAKTRVEQPAAEALHRDLKAAEARLKKSARTMARLVDDRAESTSSTALTAIKEKMARLDRESGELERQIRGIKERIAQADSSPTDVDLDGLAEFIADRLAAGASTFDEQRKIVVALGFSYFPWLDPDGVRHLEAGYVPRAEMGSTSRTRSQFSTTITITVC